MYVRGVFALNLGDFSLEGDNPLLNDYSLSHIYIVCNKLLFLFSDCNSEESLLCEPSAYSVYPQDVYRIEGQQLNITCQHPNISNNPVFQTDGVDLMCGDEDNPNCVIDVSQGRLRFDPINADNLDVTYVCVHQVSFTCFCSASFTIFRGGK